jgi:hypothetical protein
VEPAAAPEAILIDVTGKCQTLNRGRVGTDGNRLAKLPFRPNLRSQQCHYDAVQSGKRDRIQELEERVQELEKRLEEADECTVNNGDIYWVNLATVMRMMRHRSTPATLLTFVDHSTLDVTEEPEL